MRLTEQQVRFFADEGYLIVPDVFEPRELEPVRVELAGRIEEKVQELAAAGKLTNRYDDAGFDQRLARLHADSPDNGLAIIRHLEGNAGGGHAGREMFRILTHPKLAATVECLVGPEIVGSSIYRLRPKLPGVGRGIVPWHQDSGYFEPRCDAHLVLTCWVPLVDATEENGCMQILPRAHRRGICTHHTGGNAGFLVIPDDDLPFPPERAVTAACPRGGVVFMTNLTPHCSTANRSDHIRWSLDLRYQSASVPNNVDLEPDPTAKEQAPDMQIACYAPEADFVVQSRKHPERVTTYEAFVRRRQRFDEAARAGSLPYPKRGWRPVDAVSR